MNAAGRSAARCCISSRSFDQFSSQLCDVLAFLLEIGSAWADNSRAYLWEVESGLELLSFSIVSGLDFGFMNDIDIRHSPNGDRLAVGGGTSVVLFDITTGEQTKRLTIEDHRAAFYGICWSPDGTHLSAATLDPAVVTWNTESGELFRRFEAPKDRAFSTSPMMSSDGETLMAATARLPKSAPPPPTNVGITSASTPVAVEDEAVGNLLGAG